MKCNADLIFGRFGNGAISLILTGTAQPPCAQIILEAGYQQKAVSITLEENELRQLGAALSVGGSRCSIEGDSMVFTANPQNRGGPYRDGFALNLGKIDGYESTSVWMDERDAKEIADLVHERLNAKPVYDSPSFG